MVLVGGCLGLAVRHRDLVGPTVEVAVSWLLSCVVSCASACVKPSVSASGVCCVLWVRHWLLRNEGRVDVAVLWILLLPGLLSRCKVVREGGLRNGCCRLEGSIEESPGLLLLPLLGPLPFCLVLRPV